MITTAPKKLTSRKYRRFNHTPFNVKESDLYWRVEISIPGLRREDIVINADDDNYLVVKSQPIHKSNEGRFLIKEFHPGHLNLKLRMPKLANKNKINATLNNGILGIEIPKIENKKILVH